MIDGDCIMKSLSTVTLYDSHAVSQIDRSWDFTIRCQLISNLNIYKLSMNLEVFWFNAYGVAVRVHFWGVQHEEKVAV